MEEPDSLIRQEQDIARLLQSIPATTLGGRLRRARLRQGRSIRDLAEAAGLSKTSIVRLEQGKGTFPITIVKVCAALGLHLAGLTDTITSPSQNVAVHYRADDRWYDMTDFGAGPLGGQDRPLSTAERAEYAAQGVAVPLLYVRSRLPEGRLLPAVLEVFARSETRSHPGEEMVYVLNGQAQVHVGEETYLLSEGESITFYSAEPHSYAPAPGYTDAALPVRLLSIRMDERAKKTKD